MLRVMTKGPTHVLTREGSYCGLAGRLVNWAGDHYRKLCIHPGALRWIHTILLVFVGSPSYRYLLAYFTY